MKILQLGKFYPIVGGVEKVMWELAGGIACDMLCAISKSDYYRPEINFSGRVSSRNPIVIPVGEEGRCICVPALTKKAATMISPAMIFYLRRHCNEYDVIHIHHPDPMACLALFLSGYKGRVIVHWHSDILKQKTLLKFFMPLQNWMLARCEKVIGTTPVYVKASPHLQNVQDKCTFAPIGIQKISINQEKSLYLRDKYAGKKLVFSMGRLVEYKGFPYLVEAARYLTEDYVVVIGGNGPLKQKLMTAAAEDAAKASLLGKMGARVELVGYLNDEDAHAYMAAADVFVLPSIMKTEAFGIVQIEAMSAGTPVVATRIPGSGTAWVNEDGASGVNVEIRDGEALARAVVEVAGDAEKRKKYSQGALERFASLFTREAMIEKVKKIYSNEN